jgi:hypothetical protein
VFGLGRLSLCAPALQQRRRELSVERYGANPRLREGLAVGLALARSGELLKLSHAAQPVGSARAQIRQQAWGARRPDSGAHCSAGGRAAAVPGR